MTKEEIINTAVVHAAHIPELAKLDELDAKRTPGPWSQDHPTTRERETGEVLYDGAGKIIADTYNAEQEVSYEDDSRYHDDRGIRNFAFIVALENAWPSLRSHIAQLEAKVASLSKVAFMNQQAALEQGNRAEAAERQVAELTKEIERLKEALKPFADAFDKIRPSDLAIEDIDTFSASRVFFSNEHPKIRDFRRAKELIASDGEGPVPSTLAADSVTSSPSASRRGEPSPASTGTRAEGLEEAAKIADMEREEDNWALLIRDNPMTAPSSLMAISIANRIRSLAQRDKA